MPDAKDVSGRWRRLVYTGRLHAFVATQSVDCLWGHYVKRKG